MDEGHLKKIQEYVMDNYFQPNRCWIAHMKEVCNIPVKVSPNDIIQIRGKYHAQKNNQAPIKDAFRYFGML